MSDQSHPVTLGDRGSAMKQQLTEALIDYNLRDVTPVAVPHLNPIIAAARLVERLLPGECEHGKTEPHTFPLQGHPDVTDYCPAIGVWDEGIVEAVADIFHRTQYFTEGEELLLARRVLSALVELLTEKVEK